MGTQAAAPALYPNLQYDPVNDFEPIGLAAGTPILILAKKDLPPKDLKEFVAYVKANARQDQLRACRRRLGVVHDLPAAQPHPGRQADLDPLPGHRAVDERAGRRSGRFHVRPDRQRGAAGQGRHHQGLCDRAPKSAIRRCRTCRPPRRPACRSSRRRPGTRCSRPKGTPKPIVDKLSDALDKALDDEATRKRLLELGSDIPGKDRRGGAPLAALVKSEIAKWSPVIKAAGATVN